jgi:hypothetical protein
MAPAGPVRSVPVIACSACGALADVVDGVAPDAAPLGWMVERDPRSGRVTVTCPACVRRHVRAIEGKLDPEWW